MKQLKSLPRKCQYVYCTEDPFGNVIRVYKTKQRLIYVSRGIVRSYTPLELQVLSKKLTDYVASHCKKESGS